MLSWIAVRDCYTILDIVDSDVYVVERLLSLILRSISVSDDNVVQGSVSVILIVSQRIAVNDVYVVE